MTSRMFSIPVTNMINLSNPKPKPACLRRPGRWSSDGGSKLEPHVDVGPLAVSSSAHTTTAQGYACPSPRSLFHTGSTACYLFRDDNSGAESVNEFFLATAAKTNLTWAAQKAGAPVPTNAYSINGSWLIARGAVDATRKCHPAIPHGQSHVACPHCCRTNVMPGYVVSTRSSLRF